MPVFMNCMVLIERLSTYDFKVSLPKEGNVYRKIWRQHKEGKRIYRLGCVWYYGCCCGWGLKKTVSWKTLSWKALLATVHNWNWSV